jgi:hypothetical protein
MSETRNVDLDLTIEDIEQAARELGMTTSRYGTVKLYSRSEQAQLVVTSPGYSYNVGFNISTDGQLKATFDNMVQHLYGEVVATARENKTMQRLRGTGLKVIARTKVQNRVILEVG